MEGVSGGEGRQPNGLMPLGRGPGRCCRQMAGPMQLV